MSASTELRKLSYPNQANLIAFAPFSEGGLYNDGRKARGYLDAAGNVVADETVTIGADVYQFKALTTDTTRTALALANSETVSLLTLSGAPAVALAAGDLVRVENEICKIDAVIDAAAFTYRILRARCGTAVAAHAGATAVFEAAVATTTQIPVGVNATLTPAVWVPALVAEINNALQGGARAASKASTIYDPGPNFTNGSAMPAAYRVGKVIASANATAGVLIQSCNSEVMVLATTETMTNGVFTTGATMIEGVAPALSREMILSHVPTAAEVTDAVLVFPIPFTPRSTVVEVTVTATGIPKGWVGGKVYTANGDQVANPGGILVLDNTGATDWAATDTVTIVVKG